MNFHGGVGEVDRELLYLGRAALDAFPQVGGPVREVFG
jgi:hypothetical protein